MAGVSFEVVAKMDQAMATVKSGTDKITSWISDLGKQQVDWDEIFTGLLDPAVLVGGMTALFATALLSSSEFLTALQTSSADAASTFGDNLDLAGKAAQKLSEDVGISAGDAAATLGVLSASWSDSNMQMAIATDAATLAAAGLGNASDIAQQFSGVLKTFGITDVPTANVAMQELYTAARNSGIGFSDFMDIITQNAPALSAQHISIQDAANALAGFATQSGQTAATAKSSFDTIVQALANTAAPGHYLLETISGVSNALAKGDIATAIQDIEKRFLVLNPATLAFGQAAGFSTQQIDAMHNSAVSDLYGINKKAQQLADTETTLGDNLDAPETAIAKLEQAWNKATTAMIATFTPMATDFLTQFVIPSLGGVQKLLDSLSPSNFKDTVESTAEILAALFGVGPMASFVGDQKQGLAAAQAAAAQNVQQKQLQALLTSASTSNMDLGSTYGKLVSTTESNKDSGLLSKLIDALQTGNLQETQSVSSELNLNIGTINSNSKPQDIEAALYKALYAKFHSG